MDLNQLISRMSIDADAIQDLVKTVSTEQARWKPAPDQWSILEIINHLYDEEIEDFKTHLDLVLHHPSQPWSAIDPPGWVTERGYNQRDLKTSLDNFMTARMGSLVWLRRLVEPDWDTQYPAPWGTISAGDLLVSWAAHDLLHLRQLTELQYAYTRRIAAPYHLDYAGPW